MKKRLASLFLLLVLGGSTFAGVPLQFGDGECGMHGMMDCCKAALMANDSPEVAAAKLCCAVDCPTNGATSSKVAPLRAPASVRVPTYMVSLRPWMTVGVPWRTAYVHGPPGSPPAYLLNLAFLI
jgi:hypothetical protein